MITAPPAIITRAVWETCPSPLRAMQVYSPMSSWRIVEIRNSVPSLKMPTVGDGSTGFASLYHRISGVGVPSAWQLSIIESPARKTMRIKRIGPRQRERQRQRNGQINKVSAGNCYAFWAALRELHVRLPFTFPAVSSAALTTLCLMPQAPYLHVLLTTLCRLTTLPGCRQWSTARTIKTRRLRIVAASFVLPQLADKPSEAVWFMCCSAIFPWRISGAVPMSFVCSHCRSA